MLLLLIFCQFILCCNFSSIKEAETIPGSREKSTEAESVEGLIFIDKARHDELNSSPYNPALDGMASKKRFSDKFAAEISAVREHFLNYFDKFGHYGSLERYNKKLPSDWWIDYDFFSTSRVLFIDLLNPELQNYDILHGAQKELSKLENDWMLLIGHDNDYDQLGDFVEKPGEYYFWINSKRIEVYTEREKDIQIFLNSLKIQK